jgi:ferric-chelate reductase
MKVSRQALYVWLFIGFWMFDRVGRGVRLFFNRGRPKPYEAVVEAISQDSIRITLPNRHMTWKAGQHVFLTLPGISRFPLAGHPFTIANIPERDSNGKKKATDLVFYIRAMRGFTRKLQDYAAAHQGCTVFAFVDGPYGIPPPVTTFSTVVLIAGTCTSSLLSNCSS